MSSSFDDFFAPDSVMDPRALGSMQPTRLSASRSLIAKMIREKWRIEKELLTLDARGNGRARYSISTPQGPLTFLAYLREPTGGNRTSRIIGTSWDMVGSLIDGVASDEQARVTGEELPKLYEGRAPEGTLVWFRSNQSLRIFQHVRESLARGSQPNVQAVKKVGYLMRNTGLDGNGTFGTISFPAISQDHPLKVSYHAQMLAAYLMRELSIDLVEELARIDSPTEAVRLAPSVKKFIGVGNGSALGLTMFVYNRPVLINAYISAYLDAVNYVLTHPTLGTAAHFELLESLLARTIRYRALDNTSYRVFAGSKEIATDLRRIRTIVQAARRGELSMQDGETVFGAIHRRARGVVTKEAIHSLNALLLELIPDYCDRLIQERLVFEEELDLDPQISVELVSRIIQRSYAWALDLPLADESNRSRVWYQSRAAEEPRSGPRDEISKANEVVPSYPTRIRELFAALSSYEKETPIGRLVADHPHLEYIVRLILSLADKPYAVPHADPHEADFVPVWLVRFVNAFIHGLDRTEDYLNRNIRSLIFEGAPFREELSDANPSDWWWSYLSVDGVFTGSKTTNKSNQNKGSNNDVLPGAYSLMPKDSAITASPTSSEETIIIKFREARLMAGRAYQALNVPEGSWHGARDFYVTALLGSRKTSETFSILLNAAIDGETGKGPKWFRPTYSFHEQSLNIDNHGQSLLMTGHVLVNLLGAYANRSITRFAIRNVKPDEALRGLKLGLGRYGIELTVEDSAADVIGTIQMVNEPEPLKRAYSEALDNFIHNGFRVSSKAFWGLYYRSNAGLYPDTPLSRQHTGATVKDVLQPGQVLTKQFSEEELLFLMDPDDADNQASVHSDSMSAS